MIKFEKPEFLNGQQLRDELIAAGIKIEDSPYSVVIDGNHEFWLDIEESDAKKALPIVSAHVGIDSTL